MAGKYIGITIGPIHKTINNSQHFRELWGASYFFSDTMKRLLAEIKKTHLNNIVIPFADADDKHGLFKDDFVSFGAGLFTDKIIYKVIDEENDFENCLKIIKKIKTDMISGLADSEIKANFNDSEIAMFIEEYIKLYAVEKEIENDPVLEMMAALDAIELNNKIRFSHHQKEVRTTKANLRSLNPIENYLDRINSSELKKRVFSKAENKGAFKHLDHFPGAFDLSTKEIYSRHPEISSEEWNTKDLEADEFIEQLKKSLKRKDLGNAFKFRNKYYCIVYADGDNIGNTIQNLEPGTYQQFSEALFNFGIKAAEIISSFGGKPIFVGGDDLMFLAPIVSLNIENRLNESIFKLIRTLDELFNSSVSDITGNAENNITPSLSFGMAITYYKFPLYEALKLAQTQLFDKVKRKMSNYGKNAIQVYLQKHSGQAFDLLIPKGTGKNNFFDKYLILCSAQINDAKMLNTMIYKLQSAKGLLTGLEENEHRLSAFFENAFNEPVHQKDENKKYKKDIKDLLVELAITHNSLKDADGNVYKSKLNDDFVLDQYYSALRILHFIQQDESND